MKLKDTKNRIDEQDAVIVDMMLHDLQDFVNAI